MDALVAAREERRLVIRLATPRTKPSKSNACGTASADNASGHTARNTLIATAHATETPLLLVRVVTFS